MYCGSVLVAGSTYAVELPDASFRGAMAVLPTLFLELGYIIVLSLGFNFRWYHIPFFGIGLSFTGLIAMKFIPESPSYLAATGREREAKEILRSLRGIHADIGSEVMNLCAENAKLSHSSFLQLLKMPAIRKPLFVVLVLFFLNNFCGMAIFLVNMTRIFQDSGTNLNATLSSLIVFMTLLVGSTVSVFIIDHIGRRNCMALSLSILAFSLVVFGSYLYFEDFETARIEETELNKFGTLINLIQRTDVTGDPVGTLSSTEAVPLESLETVGPRYR